MVADTGQAAVDREKPSVRIARFDARFQLKIVEGVAAVGNDFAAIPDVTTGLGHPGISDDGRIIVFYGNLTAAGATRYNQQQANLEYADDTSLSLTPLTPGPGIFVSVQTDLGQILQRVAGVAGNGFLDPGETHVDTNKNGKVDKGEDKGPFSALDHDSRPGASNVDIDLRSSTIVFMATGSNGQPGIYTSRLQLSPLIEERLNVKRPILIYAQKPTLVIERSQQIEGLSGTVQDLEIYDSINNKGDIAFWVKISTGAQKSVGVATSRQLALTSLEVIQVVQNARNSVVLVEGKQTVVRAKSCKLIRTRTEKCSGEIAWSG